MTSSINDLFASARDTFDSLPQWGKGIAIGVAATAIYMPWKYWSSRPRKSPYKTNWTQDVVYLYQFPRVKFVPSMSPYCLKLETWLRMADVTYENVDIPPFSVTSREGMLPFVELNGVEYPDSSLAIRDVSRLLGKEALESQLSDENRATARAFEKMMENHTFWTFAQVRYVEKTDEFFTAMPQMFGIFQPLILIYFKHFGRRVVGEKIKTIGIGRHTRDEMMNLGLDDLRAISKYLGSKHYLTGYKPTQVDATMFGFLAQIVYAPFDSPHRHLIDSECINLREYCERIKGRYWPDWTECTEKFLLHTNWKKKA